MLDVSAKETSTKLAYASEDIDSTSLSESEYGVIKNVKKIISQSIFMTNGADGDDDFGVGNMHIALDQASLWLCRCLNGKNLTLDCVDKFFVLLGKKCE